MGLIRAQEVKAGSRHTLSFDVSSTAEREMVVTAEDKDYTRYIDEKLRIGSEPAHYSFDVDFSTDMTVDLKFQLGNIGESASAGAHQVTLSNIQWS